jgi:hypothetical protein
LGSRTNFELKDTKGSVWLYSHWGGDSKVEDLAAALEHAKPRWGDVSYAMRMVVSYLIKDNLMSDTGYGLGSWEFGEESYDPISVDFAIDVVTYRDTVYSFEEFVNIFSKHLTNA